MRVQKIAGLLFLILAFGVAANAAVVEDFSDVSDWVVDIENSDALDASIASENGDGAFFYELSTNTANDWILFKSDFAEPIDMSDPNLYLEFKMFTPADDDMFVQMRLIDANGKFVEHYFGTGTGEWRFYSACPTDTSFWNDFGNTPDFTNIASMRVEICGDNSASYTTGTVYLGDIETKVKSYTVLEDFEDLNGWNFSCGAGADSTNTSIALDDVEAQQGLYAAGLTYSHGGAVGFDYIDFYNDTVSLDFAGAKTIDLMAKMPNDPDCIIVLQIYSATGGNLEYEMPEGTGEWEFYSLSIADDFANYGDPDLSDVNLLRFRTIGDVSDIATTDTFYLDMIAADKGAPDCNLQFDVDGDCKVTIADFASFASEWQKCGWEYAGLCK